MKLTFCGAAGEVTGSCYHLETRSARVLIDFGSFQGSRENEEKNRDAPPFDASRVDAMVLTHAHIDHCGRLPLLPRLGFRGRIHATPPTCDLTPIMLKDAARLAAGDAQYETRRSLRQGGGSVEPLFDEADVERALALLTPLPYDQPREVAQGVTVRLLDAGHILGSASVEMTVEEGEKRTVLLFSGDLGPSGAPIMHDPTLVQRADVVVMESTYGDRDHRSLPETVAEFTEVVARAVWDKRMVLIPAFAVGRTQQMMFHLINLGCSGRVPVFPVFIDSPMAIEATRLYEHYQRLLETPAQGAIRYAHSGSANPRFEYTTSSDESRRLNDFHGAGVVIAGSGMCTGGRIVHHLKHHLWQRNTDVVIAGYQAEGSLGRRLVDGADSVRIFGENIVVRAAIHTLGGFSAHAGQSDLMRWAAAWAGVKPRLFLTHGEPAARDAIAGLIATRLGVRAGKPMYAESAEL